MSSTQTNGMKIGTKLRKLRMAKDYTQEYMAEVLEISQKTYSNMENDKSSISLDTLRKIAAEYKIDLIDLIQDEKIIVQNNDLKDSSTINGIVHNNDSQELILQMKARIEDLKKVIEEKNKQISFLQNLSN